MLTTTLIHAYGITNILSGYANVDELFSGEGNDPFMAAENQAGRTTNGQYFEITVGICPNGKCETQIIVFKDKSYWNKYVKDGVTLFNQTEI